MRVHIETAMAHADGVAQPGECDVPDELGRLWCASGIAREVQAKGGERETQAETGKGSRRALSRGVRWVAGEKGDA